MFYHKKTKKQLGGINMVVFILLCTIFMLIVCIYQYLENQKLKEQVSNFETKIIDIFEKNITIAPDKENVVSIKNISQNTPPQKEKPQDITSRPIHKEQEEISTLNNKENINPNKYIAKKEYEDIYELNLRNTPPQHKSQSADETIDEINKDTNFEPLDFISKKEIANLKETNSNKEYLKEVSNNLNNSINASIIELTDYEKEEEDQAVISYQELLNLKENKNNTKVEDTKFLNDLKEFRNLIDKNT